MIINYIAEDNIFVVIVFSAAERLIRTVNDWLVKGKIMIKIPRKVE